MTPKSTASQRHEPTSPRISAGLLSRSIREFATSIGFDLVGIARAVPGLASERLAQWLEQGRHGEMEYMARQQAARDDPNLVLPGVRSVVVVAMNYRTVEPRCPSETEGRVSRYAWGADYHDVMRSRLRLLRDRLVHLDPHLRCRGVVDSAPVHERDYARLAGLGWFGKNTLLLNKRFGSWLFLGALLVDRELEYDRPHETDHCGTCTACLDACPTRAFDGPYQLDPRRCISYLTIEHRSMVAEEFREPLGDWLFGCDVCQDVCPWNHRVPPAAGAHFWPAADANPLALRPLLRMTADEFESRFRGTTLWRTGRDRVVRNAALVAGNQRCFELLDDLALLLGDPNPAVREAASWAIEKIRDR